MANTREVEIVLKFDNDSKKTISTDMQRFQQVLLNMLQNATISAQLNSLITVSLYTRPLSASQKTSNQMHAHIFDFNDFDS